MFFFHVFSAFSHLAKRHQSSKESTRREDDVLAMSEDFERHVKEALKKRKEVKDDFVEWRISVMREAKRNSGETL